MFALRLLRLRLSLNRQPWSMLSMVLPVPRDLVDLDFRLRGGLARVSHELLVDACDDDLDDEVGARCDHEHVKEEIKNFLVDARGQV